MFKLIGKISTIANQFFVFALFITIVISKANSQERYAPDSILSAPEINTSDPVRFGTETFVSLAWENYQFINKIPQKSHPIDVEELNSKLTFQVPVYAGHKAQKLSKPILSKRELFQMTESSSLNFKYLDARNGLLTDEILAVAFDSMNNVWAISSSRLLRLSGTFVEEYSYKQGMPDMRPTDILTINGSVVFSTWGQGLLILRNDSLFTLNKQNNFPTDHIRSIKSVGEQIYFINSKNQLFQFNIKDFSTREVLINNEAVFVSSLFEAGTNLSFINDKGILCSIGDELKCYRLLDNTVVKSHYLFNGKTYSLTDKEELIYGVEGKFTALRSEFLKDIKYIFPAKSGSVWAITKDHLVLISDDKIRRVFKTNSKLSHMKITDIGQDKMSNLWIASSNAGVGLISPSFFSVEEFDEELINKDSDFLYVDDLGNIFLEYKEGGLIRKNTEGEFSVLKVPRMSDLTSAAFYKGSLYFSAIGGLFKLHQDTVLSYNLLPDKGFNSHLNLEATKDLLYINNYNYGIIVFDGESFTRLNSTSTLTFDSFVDEADRLWVANDDKGIAIISEDSVRYINQSTGFISNRVNAISGDLKGKVLIATNRGVFLLENGNQLTELFKEEPGSKDFVNSIYLKEKAEFWTSNETNIYMVSFKTGKPVIRKFSRNNFTSIGQIKKNSFIANGQKLYFKTGESVVKYTWFKFSYLNVKPCIQLKNINIRSDQYSNDQLKQKKAIQFESLNNQFIPIGLRLKPGQYNLSFVFDVNLWGSEEKLNFFYRLKGFSDSWIGPVDKRTIEYTNLHYGKYILEVKTYLDGELKINSLSYPFIIEKHFYQEYYFLLFIVIATLVFIFILIKTFSKLSFNSLDSYTSLSALINKMRIISILALLVIPSVAFYESEILELYQADWFLLTFIFAGSLITLISSFYKGHTASSATTSMALLYFLIVGIIFHISFERELNTTLVAESSIILLFSRLIFRKFKHLTWSFVVVFVFLILEAIYWNPSQTGLSILISTTVLCTVVVICIILVESNSVNSLSFANKILRDSNLFVLVSDLSGKIVYVSQPLLSITKKEESELLGEGWWSYRKDVSMEDFDVKSTIAEALEKSKRPKYVNQLKTPNGTLDIEWSDFSLEGKFIISIGNDVTKELKYQKEIEMLSLVATSVTNGVLIANAQNEALWFNKQLRELVGLEEEKILGTDVIKLIQTSFAETGKIIKDSSFIKKNKTQTIRLQTNFGNEKFILLTNSVVYAEDGSIRKNIFVWTDISEQYQIEKRYKDIINNAFDSIYTANYRGEFTYVNKSMELKLKMKAKDLIGRSFISLVHPADREATEEFYQNQFDNLQLYSYYEFRVIGANTEELWVGQNVRLVLDPYNKQKVLELHAVARDITENKKNREQLTRLSYVASNTENIVIILDKGFDIVWVNNAFTNVFGYRLEEVIGKNPGDFLNGRNTDAKTIQLITDKLIKKEHVSVELVNYDKFGNEKWISINMDPIFDENGKLINYIAVEDDITGRKSQQLLIQEQHDSIIDSLNYSSIIQEATLPGIKEVKSINPDIFIYYRPKEIIGGDFYLVDTLVNDYGNTIEVYIVADCTGHGVPGAMLSVLCTGILKEALIRSDIHNPAQALDFTRNKLIEIFSDTDNHIINDGMDACFLVVDKTVKTFDYSGANRPLYIVRNNEVEILKGNQQSVGFNYSQQSFTHVKKTFKKGDQVYLFSDGIIDQFGGEHSKKFLSSRFKKLLLKVKDLPMEEQKIEIDKVLMEWQGEGEQTDDICLMGVRL